MIPGHSKFHFQDDLAWHPDHLCETLDFFLAFSECGFSSVRCISTSHGAGGGLNLMTQPLLSVLELSSEG